MIYVVKDEKRILTLIPSTPSLREMAAALSVRTGQPLISDCTELWEEDGTVFARKPSLDGKNFSKYELEEKTSYIILLKGSVDFVPSKAEVSEIPDEDGFKELLYPVELPRDEAKVINVDESEFSGVHVRDAELIFAGGRGIMNQESFQALRKLAELFGASIGASRPMVDQGWATWEEQIGQTGSIVKPKVYVAFGISGAVQHITGIEKSQNIIAVNLNKEAPIFRHASFGVYADDNSIIRNMINIVEEQ